jgi:uncharacterized protein (DUF2235 family)
MARNIVICSDGTGNTFDAEISNVTQLIRLLALDKHTKQVAVYDQGIGTNAARLGAVRTFAATIPDKDALVILPAPRRVWFSPTGTVARGLGLVFGYGLEANVAETYGALACLYESPDDRIYLFGFSRGAFTVRALAGLIYRCGLPPRDTPDFGACFREAWKLYQPHHAHTDAVKEFRDRCGQRDADIHFMGVWDTVKSYGGLNPTSLPHLRHNPIVRSVRHALALDERRSWFNATTWGQLDLDKDGAATRLKEEDRPQYASQAKAITEVWFRGCHSDVGCGAIARRWMLAEAVDAGLAVTDAALSLLDSDDPAATIEESDAWTWRLADRIPRKDIDNSGVWPVKKWVFGRTGVRKPGELRRGGEVFLHHSVPADHKVAEPVHRVKTRWTRRNE